MVCHLRHDVEVEDVAQALEQNGVSIPARPALAWGVLFKVVSPGPPPLHVLLQVCFSCSSHWSLNVLRFYVVLCFHIALVMCLVLEFGRDARAELRSRALHSARLGWDQLRPSAQPFPKTRKQFQAAVGGCRQQLRMGPQNPAVAL